MSPSVLVVEHEPGCPPDRLAGWLTAEGCALDVRRPYAGNPLPSLGAGGVDGLVVLGGQMGAYDDQVAPWLAPTRQLLREAVHRELPVLGICLGAQLLSVACGGRVEPGVSGTEAGVVDVSWRPQARTDPLVGGLPDPFPGPSMHDDAVVDLPVGAAWLGSTRQYPHQVFRVGRSAWGVQFHPEVSLATFQAWAGHHPRVDPADAVGQLRERDQEVRAAGRELTRRFAAIVRASVDTSARSA